jgi:hypothetical protein
MRDAAVEVINLISDDETGGGDEETGEHGKGRESMQAGGGGGDEETGEHGKGKGRKTTNKGGESMQAGEGGGRQAGGAANTVANTQEGES